MILAPSGVEVVSSGPTALAGLDAGDVAAVDGVTLVPNLAADPRFAGGSWARMAPGTRALALAPLDHASGRRLGVLAVMHTEPRAWTATDAELLGDLAAMAAQDVTAHVEIESKLRETEGRYRVLFEKAGAGICILDAEPATNRDDPRRQRSGGQDVRLRPQGAPGQAPLKLIVCGTNAAGDVEGLAHLRRAGDAVVVLDAEGWLVKKCRWLPDCPQRFPREPRESGDPHVLH